MSKKALQSPILITCEHASNHVPRWVARVAQLSATRLKTHHAYDFGAKPAAQFLKSLTGAPLILGTVSRLAIDLNRPEGDQDLFKQRSTTAAIRLRLLTEYHRPHWQAAQDWADRVRKKYGTIIHVSIHSFTPVLNGKRRSTHLGILYDPGKANEADFATSLSRRLSASTPSLKVKHNYPYLGTAPGLTSYLRTQFPADCYIGLELEFNQRLFREGRNHIVQSALRTFVDLANSVPQTERNQKQNRRLEK